MVKDIKKVMVKEIKKKIDNSELVIFTQYSGLGVSSNEALRGDLRKVNAEYKVYKNTLVKRALSKDIEGLDSDAILAGPTSFVFSETDPVTPAKIVAKFSKENEALQIKGGLYQNAFITSDKVKELASLPSREELLAKLVYLLNAPISGLVNVLHGNLRKLVYALNAIKDTKK